MHDEPHIHLHSEEYLSGLHDDERNTVIKVADDNIHGNYDKFGDIKIESFEHQV